MSKSINQKLAEFGLRIEVKPISELKRYPNNPRVHDEQSIEAIQRSIDTFGFKNVVVVDSDYEVIAGHGRLEALERIGKTKVPVLVATDLDKWQAAALRIADNRTTELSSWDEDKLTSEIEALEANIEGLDLSFLELEELNLDLSKFDPPPEIPKLEPMIKSECYISIYCSRERLEAFKEVLEKWNEYEDVTVDVQA